MSALGHRHPDRPGTTCTAIVRDRKVIDGWIADVCSACGTIACATPVVPR